MEDTTTRNTEMHTFSDELISDLHKDAYGFRPRADYMYSWQMMSDDEKQVEWDYLNRVMERAIMEERARELKAITLFERLVDDTIATGAKDRETALRWIMDSSSAARDNDWDYLCYEHGLPYGYFRTKK